MINHEVLNYLVGSLSFGLATVFGIRLGHELTVPTAAALAPPLSLLAVALPVADRPIVWVAPLFTVLVLLLARRSLHEVSHHVIGLIASLVVIDLLFNAESSVSAAALATCLMITLVYSVTASGVHAMRKIREVDLRQDLVVWLLLQGVLLCACGVTVLMLARMGLPAFLAMAGVLALTKREFDAFGKSRIAYDQTVRALDRLSQRSDTEHAARSRPNSTKRPCISK